MKEVITSCTCDCPDTCSIIAKISGDRVKGIRGNPDFKLTGGSLCLKSAGFLKRVFSPERILHPLLKQGSVWKRVSWDHAADVVAGKIEQALGRFGPLSLFYYKDGGSLAALKSVNERLFNLLGGATFATGSLCGGAGIAGQTLDFGLRTAHDPSDLLNSGQILIWGRNPAWTNVHLVPILKEAKRRGIRLVLIDPVRTATADLVDEHVGLVPGTDMWLAAGMAKVLERFGLIDGDFVGRCTNGSAGFLAAVERLDLDACSEVTGVTTHKIAELASRYALTRPAAILGGWGIQRRRNGARTYRMLDALGALTGNIGVRGGGVNHGMDEMRWFDKRVRLVERAGISRAIPRPETGKGLIEAADPPIEVAVVSGANPLNQCPNTNLVRKAFAGIDFVVVLDMFMTDTAQAADMVLPTTHFLQERDIVGSYWHNFVMPVNVAQPRLGEEKTDLEIFSLIAGRLGLGQEFGGDPDPYLDSLISPLKREGLTLNTIMEGPVRPAGAVDVPFSDGKFPTESSRFEFVREIARPEMGEPDDYAYHLISPHPKERSHSQLADGFSHRLPAVHISSETAETNGLRDGDNVGVETPQGRLDCVAVISDAVRPDTVVIYEGWWERLGGSVNRLTSDRVSDKGLSATYNDLKCRLIARL
ncbi:MAG: molybdopterin-dependent oxidoreductase [Candidatus Eisenbacteria bacterium]